MNSLARKAANAVRAAITACAVALLVITLTACTAAPNKKSDSPAASTSETQQETKKSYRDFVEKDDPYATGKHHATIEVKGYGTITVELNAGVAPITVSNFAHLAEKGFYDGLTFHRIISGFMIQGGDPNGNGTGGSDMPIKGEFSSNGVNNTISHTRGVISMARSQAPNSASSQFFIMHQDNPSLDGQYAAFGQVTDGMDVVDAICRDTQVEDRNGTVAQEHQPVITSVKMID
ncbi:peptidylprolyl isomerase [Atopobium sp. oral taxon 199]|uniref:peptidylprolyl isomerase n=1 Tax=Atopobium sp. oral taxon 199 TaxID=712156 RepID=UPI00034E7BB1|nr:peptidylprolyl isomerase [Atopobium sp. oral taxon 199]EPD78321.1 peptidyl-prolyl cis-trans isomerase B (cyclophilin B) [Atopobium sp. oral taxon 199 str. F0494]